MNISWYVLRRCDSRDCYWWFCSFQCADCPFIFVRLVAGIIFEEVAHPAIFACFAKGQTLNVAGRVIHKERENIRGHGRIVDQVFPDRIGQCLYRIRVLCHDRPDGSAIIRIVQLCLSAT